MQKVKSSKFIGQIKSSLYNFSHNPSISIQGEEKKKVSNKSKNLDFQEKPPNETEKQASLKSSVGLKSLKIPNKKKSEVLDIKEKRRAELSPVLFNLSGNDLGITVKTKSSISPKMYRQLSPLSDSVYEPKKTNYCLDMGSQGKILLRHLNVDKEIYINQQTFKTNFKFKPRPCLEDIIILNESKELTNFAFIEKNIKLCSQIINNLMCRMVDIGKKTEALLLDSLWRHVIVTIDETIEAFMHNQKNLQFNEKEPEFNCNGSIKSHYFEPQSWENEGEKIIYKQEEFEKSIEKIQNYFDSLSKILKQSETISEKPLKFFEKNKKQSKNLEQEEGLENLISIKDFQ